MVETLGLTDIVNQTEYYITEILWSRIEHFGICGPKYNKKTL